LTGSSKATGSATNFTGINELALDAIVSFGYVNTSSITVTYGAIWNGSTTSFVDNANPNLSDETRLNSLYFKCENLNNTICDLVLPAPTTTPANRCGDGTVTITATGCSGIYTWYNSATGGTAIGTGNTYTTPVLSNNYTYYVDCDAVGCTSTRTSLLVTIYSLPTAPTVADKNNCGTGNITLSASGCTGGTIQWYASQTGTASLATGTSMTLTALSSSAVYFVACTDANACVSATRNYGLATINAFPKATATNINPTCLGLQSTDSGKILISQFKTNETYSWNTGATYNAGTATSPQVIPTNGEIFPSATAPASSVTYNVRIKNIENCFIDLPITITNTCTNCPVSYCEPPSSIVKTK
jgi:hypothetical protein